MPTLTKPRKKKSPPAAATNGQANGHGDPLPRRVVKRYLTPATLDPADVDPSPFQPRQQFPDDEIQQLAESIANQGQLAPILVRPVGDRYELLEGERRLRAIKLLGFNAIRAEVGDFSDKECREIVLVSAIQKKDLNAIEEAIAFQRAIDAGDAPGPTELARQLGLSQGHVSNRLRLLELPESIRADHFGEIPPTHARELVGLKDHPKILGEIVKQALKGGECESIEEFRGTINWAVRKQTEELEGQRYDSKHSRQFKHFTPTEEQRAQLGIVTIEGWNGKPEERATNTKLWDKLQSAYEKEVLAREANKKAKGEASSKTKKPAAELTPAQRKQLEADERRKKAEQAKQFAKRLYEWKISWLQYLIAKEIPTVSQERLMAMLCLAAADWGLGGMGTREWLAAAITATGGQLKKSKRHFGKDLCGAMADLPAPDRVAADLLARCFWDDKGPRTCVDDDDVETIADEFLGIDLADRWADGQAGPLSEAYWNLHTKEQLQDLAAELKVDLPSNAKKADAVQTFLKRMPSPDDSANEDAEKWLPLPKEIRQAKRPK